jgi:hypothetical protein
VIARCSPGTQRALSVSPSELLASPSELVASLNALSITQVRGTARACFAGEEAAIELARRTLEGTRIYGAMPFTALPKLLIVSAAGMQRDSYTRAYQQAVSSAPPALLVTMTLAGEKVANRNI